VEGAVLRRETRKIRVTRANGAGLRKERQEETGYGTRRGDKTGHAACDTIEDVTQRFFAHILRSARRLRTAWTSHFL
jgi:hypothetical protein